MNRSHIIEALRAADWSNTPIGNKAMIQAAIEHLEAQPSSAFRPARVISYRPGMGEVTSYVAGGVPGYMNIGDTVYVSDRAPGEQPGATSAQSSPEPFELTARVDQLEHERDLLGQALGECIEAAGVTNPGVALTGPQLLLFAEDLKAHIGGLRGQLADTAIPMQPLIKDDHGVARFKANKIVNHLLDYASERGCGMTELAKLQFPDEDYMQFAQLIGYSVSGYSDLSYVSDDSRGLAYAKLDLLTSTPDVADAQVEQVERPEVVGTAVLMLEAAGWRNDDPKASVTSVSELLSCIVGTLRAANAKLEKELAMSRDAASKGDTARHAAGGMEMEIQELREKVTEMQKEMRSRWTYASTQATNCAGCGEHKHTPLRVDWMGGYVCLTCIDEKLEELHDDQDQRSVPEGFREKFEQCLELAFAEISDYVSPEKACNPQSRARRASALATELRAMLASSEES